MKTSKRKMVDNNLLFTRIRVFGLKRLSVNVVWYLADADYFGKSSTSLSLKTNELAFASLFLFDITAWEFLRNFFFWLLLFLSGYPMGATAKESGRGLKETKIRLKSKQRNTSSYYNYTHGRAKKEIFTVGTHRDVYRASKCTML